MSAEKVEGATQECSKCKTPLICVKIIKEWQGKKEEKLQWQNVSDRKPHFKFTGPNNYACVVPTEPGPQSSENSDDYLKQKQKQILENNTAKNEALGNLQETKFTESQIANIIDYLDRLMVIEKIVIDKLQGSGETPLNPAKVGMYMKFVCDKLEG